MLACKQHGPFAFEKEKQIKMRKKILAVLFAVCIAASLNTVTASASQDDTTLVDIDYITSANAAITGNIFAITDTISFSQTITNKENESVVSNYSWNVTDETGTTVAACSGSDVLGAAESKMRSISIPNPGKYGIYTINVTEENYRSANQGTKYTANYKDEFSVCISLDSNNIDENFGFNHKLIGQGGEYEKSAPLMQKAGARWHRESVMWAGVEPPVHKDGVEYIDDKYINLDKYKLKLEYTKNIKGINTVCVLTGRNSKYDGNNCPTSPTGIEAYADFCSYVATELHGLVDHFEIWNEWNVTNFNPSRESPEDYANLLKASYSAIKAVDSNIVVIGCDCSGILPVWSEKHGEEVVKTSWMRRVFAALNDGDTHMDAISVHCYDYSATDGFPEMQFINEVQSLKELMRQYNIDVPIWLTETGFSTYDANSTSVSTKGFVPGCTKDVQLNSMVLINAVNKAYGLFDKVIQYCFYDENCISFIEYNWGVLNCRDREGGRATTQSDIDEILKAYPGLTSGEIKLLKLVPYGAKPAYLGIAAMNYFIGGNTTYVDKKKSDRCYAFEFHNNNLNKDVLLAINGGIVNNMTQTFDLGCQSVDVYDKYGNFKTQLSSATGVYSVETYADPIYIVGDFGKFEEVSSDIRLRASVDVNTNLVTISGNVPEPYDLVSIMVVTKGPELSSYDASRVKFLGQTTADGDGNFSASYTADTLEGEYQIYVNTKERRSKVIKDLVLSYSLPGITVTKNDQTVTDISLLSAGDRPVVKLTGLNISSDSNAQLIVAQYSGGELINVKFTDAAGTFTTLGSEFLSDFTVAAGADTIRIMYWYMDTLVPIIEQYTID